MLYLRAELLNKSEQVVDGKPKSKAGFDENTKGAGRGEHRGGDYAARTQIGIEKDGSPKYRYFKTRAEFEEYQSRKSKSKGAEELEAKVKKEHAASTEKHKPKQDEDKKPNSLSKRLPIFVRVQ
jgi:hypothetical protein